MALTKVTGAGANGLTLSSTDLKIDSGDLIFSTANKGVVLGATSNTDANTISDYEEGTWTPAYGGSSVAPTATYDKQTGIYVKVGDLVHVQGRLRTDATSGGSGNLRVIGLPFANSNQSEAYSTLHIGYNVNWSADHFPTSGLLNASTSHVTLYTGRASDFRDGRGIVINVSDLTNSTNSNDIIFSMTYRAA